MYIIPKPKKIQVEDNIFFITHQCKIVIQKDCKKQVDIYARILKEDCNKLLGYSLQVTRGEKKEGNILLAINTKLQAQEYQIIVNQDGIQILGGDNAGILYGIQTLRQIIDQEAATIPYLVMEDRPSIENRGFYHDSTRGRIPTLSYLKSLVDKLAYYKINQFQLYIEHSFLFEHLSEVWRDDTPLTPDEILELDQYCIERNIELVPSLSSFGHLYKLLNTKMYSYLCELEGMEKEPFGFLDRLRHHTIDVSNPGGIHLIKQMIEEFLPLFQSNQFNICADETFDLGKGRSKELAERLGTKRIYIDYVKELCEFLVEKGKRPMFWGDIICAFPEAIKELPKETICLSWGYAPDQSEDAVKSLASVGAVQYLCPGVSGWNQWVNLLKDSYNNITRMCGYAEKYNAFGVLNTDWGDFGHINHPDFSLIGMIYGAAFSWNTEFLSFEEINMQISKLLYQDKKEQVVSILAKVADNSMFHWEQTVKYMEFCKNGATNIEMEELLGQLDFSKIKEKQKRLNNVIQELYFCIKELDTEKRSYIKPYLIAIEGMQLFNEIGRVVKEKIDFELEENKGYSLNLASKLEHWFYNYKEIWRSVSKESELYRIQDVIIWYADYLRDLEIESKMRDK